MTYRSTGIRHKDPALAGNYNDEIASGQNTLPRRRVIVLGGFDPLPAHPMPVRRRTTS